VTFQPKQTKVRHFASSQLPTSQVTLFSSLVFFSFIIIIITNFLVFTKSLIHYHLHLVSYATMAKNFSYILLTLLFTVTVTASTMDDVKPSTPLVSFLEILQHTAFNTFGNSNFDPKTYVDLPLKFPLSVTDHAFQNLPKSSTGSVSVHDLNRFIETYFHAAGDDLVYSDPQDFVPDPEGFLPKVKNPQVRAWAIKVHSLWKNLSRKVSSEVKTHPSYHTLLPVPGSVVIPGSRFREVYYWDSYWVIRFVCSFLSANVEVIFFVLFEQLFFFFWQFYLIASKFVINEVNWWLMSFSIC